MISSPSKVKDETILESEGFRNLVGIYTMPVSFHSVPQNVKIPGQHFHICNSVNHANTKATLLGRKKIPLRMKSSPILHKHIGILSNNIEEVGNCLLCAAQILATSDLA